jgi:hypothetical protein
MHEADQINIDLEALGAKSIANVAEDSGDLNP